MKRYRLQVVGLAVACQILLSACGSSERMSVPIDTTAAAAARKTAGRAQLDAEAAARRGSFSVSDPAMTANTFDSGKALTSAGSYDSKQKSFNWMQALQMSAIALAPMLLMNGSLDFQNLLPGQNKMKEPSSGGTVVATSAASPNALAMASKNSGDTVIVTDGPSTIGPVLAQNQKPSSTNDRRSSGENGDANHHPVEKQSTADRVALCFAQSPHAEDIRDTKAIVRAIEDQEKGVKI